LLVFEVQPHRVRVQAASEGRMRVRASVWMRQAVRLQRMLVLQPHGMTG
jgi:hypothetical protein